MSARSYGQACSVANFLDRLGDRWTLLIIRDLLIGPRRFKQLLEGLKGIGPNLLSQRLESLRDMDVVEKVRYADSSHHAWQLTPRGRELEGVILQMQRWGMRNLQAEYAGKTQRPELLVVALRAAFHPEHAAQVTAQFELRLDDVTLHARVTDGQLKTGPGPAPEPDLVIITSADTFHELAFSRLDPETARKTGALRVVGKDSALATFRNVFSLKQGG